MKYIKKYVSVVLLCAVLVACLPRTVYTHTCKFRADITYSFDNIDVKCDDFCKKLDAKAKAQGKKGCCDSHAKIIKTYDQHTAKSPQINVQSAVYLPDFAPFFSHNFSFLDTNAAGIASVVRCANPPFGGGFTVSGREALVRYCVFLI